jgi:hemerythrin-like metal-binding protein
LENELAYFPWCKEYEIGVSAIDSEHRHLVNLVVSLHEAKAIENGQDRCLTLLSQIVKHTKRHFEHEENLMMESGYPGLDDHRVQHADLISSVTKICEWIETDPSAVSDAVLRYLKKWLLDHIATYDKDMGTFLNQRIS